MQTKNNTTDLKINDQWNQLVSSNFAKVKSSLLLIPMFLLLATFLFLYSQNALSTDKYIEIQKDCFFFLNAKLSQFPQLAYNLIQFGDAIIFLSLLSIFILYVPKLWEALLSASLISALFSNILKSFFAIPRPAAIFDHSSFVIIGKVLAGHNSLPSGHSITAFTIITVLMYGFMPKKLNNRILWVYGMMLLALLLAFTRVAVGAHYPLDVIIGGIIGYISGLLGIFIGRKYNIWSWISNRKFYPVFMVVFLVAGILIINRITKENLLIYYFSLICLLFSLYKIITIYVKK